MSILTRAAEIVDGARQKAYGHPRDNHGTTAAFWTHYLRRRGLLSEDVELNARDVCMLNVLQKVCRDANAPKEDNLVDIAGFARNAEMIEEADASWEPLLHDMMNAIRLRILDWRERHNSKPDKLYIPRWMWDALGGNERPPQGLFGVETRLDEDLSPNVFEISREDPAGGIGYGEEFSVPRPT